MEKEKYEIVEVQKPDRWFGVRHIQYVLFFTAALIAYAIRASITVGIIAMISNHPPSTDIPTYPEWAPKKNVILSAFFWGYLATQIIAGQLAERYGPKWFLAITFSIGSLFSILTPSFGAWFGYEGVLACRIIQGLSQGFLFPCLHNLLGKWCPAGDRAKACGFSYAGSPLGTVIAMPITGLISDSKDLGWPVAYYLFGALGFIWTITWIVIGSDGPSTNRFISNSERKYILCGLKSEIDESKTGKLATPWFAILTSLPFWAILINDCGESWGYWTLLTEIPSFMQNILNFDIASNSLLSALPYLVSWLLSNLMGLLADYLILKKYTSITWSRRIFNSTAMFIPAIALACLSFVGRTERVLSVALLVVAVGFSGGIFCGYVVNHIDLAPNFSGTLMGTANTVSNVFSLLAPLYVDAVIHVTGYKETSEELWTIIFCTAAGIFIFVGIIFVFASSGKVQPWNSPDYARKRIKIKNCLI